MFFILFLVFSVSSGEPFSSGFKKNSTLSKDLYTTKTSEWLLQTDCGLEPYDGAIISFDFIFWRIEDVCDIAASNCKTLEVIDCAYECENDSSCNSVTYNEDQKRCCKSTNTFETAGTLLRNDCSGYDFWQKNCPGGQDIVRNFCNPLGCGPMGLFEDTSYTATTSGNIRACRCPGESVKCGTSCVDIETCNGGPCDIRISGISGSNANVLNQNFIYDGLFDSQPSYIRFDGEAIFLWRSCQYGVWIINQRKGDVNSISAYIHSNAFLAEDISGGGLWRVYDPVSSWMDDHDVLISCQ